MFRNTKQMGRWLAIAMAIGLVCSSGALAKKPDNPPGGEEPPPPRFTLIELTGFADANGISPVSANGDARVVGPAGDFPGYARVASSGVVESGTLPDTGFGPGLSSAQAANTAGTIVGFVPLPDPTGQQAYLFRAAVWARSGQGFTLNQLGVLPGFDAEDSFAYDLNDLEMVVGDCGGRACLWDPVLGPMDLNTLLPENSAWELTLAWRINNLGQIVGRGLLQGEFRGFLLDLASGDVTPVPLVPGRDSNDVGGLSAVGHVAGVAFGGQPDEGYVWSGVPGDVSVQLAPVDASVLKLSRDAIVVDAYGHPSSVNQQGVIAGTSRFTVFSPKSGEDWRSKATFWENGGQTAAALETVIPDGDEWDLRYALDMNESGWIVGYGVKVQKGKNANTDRGRGYVLVPIEP